MRVGALLQIADAPQLQPCPAGQLRQNLNERRSIGEHAQLLLVPLNREWPLRPNGFDGNAHQQKNSGDPQGKYQAGPYRVEHFTNGFPRSLPIFIVARRSGQPFPPAMYFRRCSASTLTPVATLIIGVLLLSSPALLPFPISFDLLFQTGAFQDRLRPLEIG